jgi:hypothetical protein
MVIIAEVVGSSAVFENNMMHCENDERQDI